MSKPKSSSAPKTQTISKYFIAADKQSSISPYKDSCFAEIRSTNAVSDDDFKTPTLVNKVSKVSAKVQQRKTKRKSVKSAKVTSVKHFFKHSNLDVNPDHLQLALALSESQQIASQSDHSESPSNSQENSSLVSFKQALEKYGIKCSKQLPVQHRKVPVKRNPKSRFRFVTPILNIRTNEERDSLISTKISLILIENQNKPVEKNPYSKLEIFSDKLKENFNPNRKLFHFGCLSFDELNEPNRFYVNSLNIEPSGKTSGCLLKSWANIPGREKSPERTIQKEEVTVFERSIHESPTRIETEINTENSPDKMETVMEEIDRKSEFPANSDRNNVRDCYSPDLFESMCEDFTKCNEEPPKMLDLTQSSEEEKMSFDDNFRENHSGNSTILLNYSKVSEMALGNLKSGLSEDFDAGLMINDPNKSQDNLLSKARIQNEISTELDNKKHSPLNRIHSFTSNNSQESSMNPESIVISDDEIEELKIKSNLNSNKNSFQSQKSQEFSSSQDSIVISDDELNYSSRFYTPVKPKTAKKKSKYDLSTFDEDLGCSSFSPSSEEDEACTSLPKETLNQHCSQKSNENSIRNDEIEQSSSKADCFDDSLHHQLISVDDLLPEHYYNNAPSFRYNSLHMEQNAFYDLQENPIGNEEPQPSTSKMDCFDDTLNKLLNRESVLHQIEAQIPSGSPVFNKKPTEFIEESTKTPDNQGFIVKTKNITPMLNYDSMNTPKLVEELGKFGLKPLKRPRGVQMLKYIYDSTHPVLENEHSSDEESTKKVTKKRKTTEDNPSENQEKTASFTSVEIVGDIVKESDELIFERTSSKKIHSCRIPLQIAWFNFLSCNPEIKRSMLLYEPLQVEVLHSMLKELGFKFNIQDLVAFLDKHCITIRTAQTQNIRRRRTNKK